MAPGSTKSRRAARKFALREDDPAAQYEVSHRKETRITPSGRKKVVVIEESLRNDPAPPPKKKRKTSSAPAAEENSGRLDEHIDQPDMDFMTGHNRPSKVCIFDSGPRPANLQISNRPRRIIFYNLCTGYILCLKHYFPARRYRRTTLDVQVAPTKIGPYGDARIAD